MKSLAHGILVLAAALVISSLTGAWSGLQDPKQKKMEPNAGKQMQQKMRAEKLALLRKTLPELKVKLPEAIALAEKETGGTAYSAGIEFLSGKASIQVNLIANERYSTVGIDPETKKVTVQKLKGEDGSDQSGGGEGESGQ